MYGGVLHQGRQRYARQLVQGSMPWPCIMYGLTF